MKNRFGGPRPSQQFIAILRKKIKYNPDIDRQTLRMYLSRPWHNVNLRIEGALFLLGKLFKATY